MLRIRKKRTLKWRQISMGKCTQMNRKSKEKARKMERRSLMKKWETLMMRNEKLI